MSHETDVEKKVAAIAQYYGIAALYVFGSRADEIASMVKSQEIKPVSSHSDIDIGAHPGENRPLTAQERVKLAIELESILDAIRVDLVVLPEADPFLALDIVRGELIYCADADEQSDYELFVLRRAGDLAPYAHEKWREILTGSGT